MRALTWMGYVSTVLCLIAAHDRAIAQAKHVDLELVLAVDVSRSMDIEEQQLQRDGYAAAFRHPEVVSAIASGPLGRIAVTYVEWAGPNVQTVVVPWTIIAGESSALAFSDKIATTAISRERGTSISGGLDFASRLFAESGVQGLRRTIDVSGDGPNNMGLPVVSVRDQVVADGITINGLPIMLRPGGGFGAYGIRELDIYYEDCVIGGPGAFLVTVDDTAQFPEAIRRKLVLEIAWTEPEPRLIPVSALAPRIDCLIGEKRRERYMYDRF
jgi:hypothetical protein